VHEAFTVNEELLLAMTQQARSLGSVLPGAPPEVVELVDKALAFAPADRFADATAMREAVKEVRERLTLIEEYPTLIPGADDWFPNVTAPELRGPEAPPYVRPLLSTLRIPMRRPKLLLALGLAAAAATVAGAIDWLVRDREPRALVTEPARRTEDLPASTPSATPAPPARAPEPPGVPVTSLPLEEPEPEKPKPAARRWPPVNRKVPADQPPTATPEPEPASAERALAEGAASASEVSISITKPPNTLVRPKAPATPDPLSRRK
jgi:hypothetical protein